MGTGEKGSSGLRSHDQSIVIVLAFQGGESLRVEWGLPWGRPLKFDTQPLDMGRREEETISEAKQPQGLELGCLSSGHLH